MQTPRAYGLGDRLASASGATLASAVASPVLDSLGIWTPDTGISTERGPVAHRASAMLAQFGDRVGDAIDAVGQDQLAAD